MFKESLLKIKNHKEHWNQIDGAFSLKSFETSKKSNDRFFGFFLFFHFLFFLLLLLFILVTLFTFFVFFILWFLLLGQGLPLSYFLIHGLVLKLCCSIGWNLEGVYDQLWLCWHTLVWCCNQLLILKQVNNYSINSLICRTKLFIHRWKFH